MHKINGVNDMARMVNLTRTLEARLLTGERHSGRVAMGDDRYLTVHRVTGCREHVRCEIPFGNNKLIRRYESHE